MRKQNPSLQLRVLTTFWQLLQLQFLNCNWTPNESVDSSNFSSYFNYYIFSSCISSSFPAFLLSRPSVVFACCCSDEVDYWIRGVATCSEGGFIGRSVAKQTPTYMQKFCLRERSIKGLIL